MDIQRVLKSNLFANILSLGAIQGINYILPLVTIPFLYNQLGVENYGLVNFSFAFMQYFIILTDFGYGLSGTRYISKHRDDLTLVNRFLNSACFSRFLFSIISLSIVLICTCLIPSLKEHKIFTLLFFGQVFGNVLNPTWFFQGMEKMKYNTIIHVVTKIISIIPLFFIIKKPTDYIFIPICYSGGAIIAGIFSMYLLVKEFGMKLYFTSLKEIINVTIDSSRYFLSRISVSFYSNTNSFVLGLVCGNVAVGYFSLADKIYNALNQVYGPINNALFPYMTRKKELPFFKKILSYGTIINSFFIILFILIFPHICSFVMPDFSQYSMCVLYILCVANIIDLPATFLGYPFLAAWGHPNFCNYSIMISALIHLLSLYVLYLVGGITIYSVAVLIVLCEIYVLVIRIYGVYKYKLWK